MHTSTLCFTTVTVEATKNRDTILGYIIEDCHSHPWLTPAEPRTCIAKQAQ